MSSRPPDCFVIGSADEEAWLPCDVGVRLSVADVERAPRSTRAGISSANAIDHGEQLARIHALPRIRGGVGKTPVIVVTGKDHERDRGERGILPHRCVELCPAHVGQVSVEDDKRNGRARELGRVDRLHEVRPHAPSTVPTTSFESTSSSTTSTRRPFKRTYGWAARLSGRDRCRRSGSPAPRRKIMRGSFTVRRRVALPGDSSHLAELRAERHRKRSQVQIAAPRAPNPRRRPGVALSH